MSNPVEVVEEKEHNATMGEKGETGEDEPHSPPGLADPEKSGQFQSAPNSTDDEAIPGPPQDPVQEPALQKWNEPRVNMLRFFTTLYSFIILGMNDGAIGVSTGKRKSGRVVKSANVT
jgi:hypothetical protein